MSFNTPKFDKKVAQARAKGHIVEVTVFPAAPDSLSYGEKIASVNRRCLCVSSQLKNMPENYRPNTNFKI